MPNATVMIVRDESTDPRCVVTHADDLIWVDPELWAQVNDPSRERIPGDGQADGDLFTFGTEGEGLGRLTYRRTGYVHDGFGCRWITFERVQPEADRG